MDALTPVHLLIIAAVFVLLFGAKRLPDGARSLGRSMRIFKSELRGMHEDDEQAKTTASTAADHVPASLPVAAPVVTPVAQPVAQPVVPTDQAAAGSTSAGQPPVAN